MARSSSSPSKPSKKSKSDKKPKPTGKSLKKDASKSGPENASSTKPELAGALEALRPILEAIPDAELRTANMPIAEAFQEAQDLAAFVGLESTAQVLRAVGLPNQTLEALPLALAAAREAQSRWIVLRDFRKNGAQKVREEDGAALRTRMVSACRWSLRKDRVAHGTLEAIQEGDSLADMVQDLRDLAHLAESRLPAFEADQTFDAATVAAEARNLADAISQGLSRERLEEDQAAARRLRDQAFTHLDLQVDEVREAGRYAFVNDPDTRRAFASAYKRRRRQKEARKTAAA